MNILQRESLQNCVRRKKDRDVEEELVLSRLLSPFFSDFGEQGLSRSLADFTDRSPMKRATTDRPHISVISSTDLEEEENPFLKLPMELLLLFGDGREANDRLHHDHEEQKADERHEFLVAMIQNLKPVVRIKKHINPVQQSFPSAISGGDQAMDRTLLVSIRIIVMMYAGVGCSRLPISWQYPRDKQSVVERITGGAMNDVWGDFGYIDANNHLGA
ncbi:hypothetical protein DY000_02014056 [Brassica cretica]|uniref:Uncharacterized protein n=1 Tax=Brassica cretica TaxID=69181 RepID=A0ABQ7D9X0_BRACR|nr:hypothetical protein DY000_02014056 [Brassica cretica]